MDPAEQAMKIMQGAMQKAGVNRATKIMAEGYV